MHWGGEGEGEGSGEDIQAVNVDLQTIVTQPFPGFA